MSRLKVPVQVMMVTVSLLVGPTMSATGASSPG